MGGGAGTRRSSLVVPQNEHTFCFSNSRYVEVSQQLGHLIVLCVTGMELAIVESVKYEVLPAPRYGVFSHSGSEAKTY